MADHVCTQWGYRGHGGRNYAKPRRPASEYCLTHQMAQCAVVCIIFSPWSWCDETLLKNWLQQSAIQDSDAQNNCLNNVSFMCFMERNLFKLAIRKNSRNDWLCASVATKNKDVGEECFLHMSEVQWVTDGVCQNVVNRLNIHWPHSRNQWSLFLWCARTPVW